MKVGDYVRTKYGIAKVISTKVKDEDDNNVLQVDKMLEPYFCDGCDRFLCDPKDVIKSSPRIIDLVQVGDYVNGARVTNFMFDGDKKIGVFVEATAWGYDADEIKSIVTKEQFSSMEYKVNE